MQSFKMIFSGVTILQGVEFPIFPIDFAWALQQCSATALPVITITIFELIYNERSYVVNYECTVGERSRRRWYCSELIYGRQVASILVVRQ